eukprot:scpid111857/ scgid1710/ 
MGEVAPINLPRGNSPMPSRVRDFLLLRSTDIDISIATKKDTSMWRFEVLLLGDPVRRKWLRLVSPLSMSLRHFPGKSPSTTTSLALALHSLTSTRLVIQLMLSLSLS